MTKEELTIKLLSVIENWNESTSISDCKTDVKNLIDWEEKFDSNEKTSSMTPYELGKFDSTVRPTQIGESRCKNPFVKDTDEWFDYIKGFKGKK